MKARDERQSSMKRGDAKGRQGRCGKKSRGGGSLTWEMDNSMYPPKVFAHNFGTFLEKADTKKGSETSAD
jgi:hypothetical protein